MIEGRELSDRKMQINSLDGLRGFAVLSVFLSHTSNTGILLLPFANFSGIGRIGVFLFFLLSSFLLSLPFIKNGSEGKSMIFLLNYLIRRFFRIYPLFFLYLLLGLVTSLTLWKIFEFRSPLGIPFYLSVNSFIDHLILEQGRGVTWSILVEFRYYFVLPLLALTYSVVLKSRLIPSIILTVILIVLSQIFWPESETVVNDSRLGPYLPIFFMGSLLALVFHRWQESTLKNSRRALVTIEVLGLLALTAIVLMTPSIASVIMGEAIAFNYYHKQIMLFGLLWSIVLFSCVAGLGILKKFFENKVLRYLGFISFSVYLWHIVVLDLVRFSKITIPGKGWIILVITILISHISWAVIEKPLSKVKLRKG